MSDTFDFVVVGAGVIGAATAYALARPGRSVLLLEQHEIGHALGSSHGGSRIIRYAHPTPDYASLMPAIFELWRRLEVDSGKRLLLECGGLFVAVEGDPFLAASHEAMTALGMPCRLLSTAELNFAYPQFRLQANDVGLFDPHGGILAASEAVAAMVQIAVRRGCTLLEHAHVESVEPEGEISHITYRHAGRSVDIRARRAILCAGPWACRLLEGLLSPPLPLKVTHQQVAYFAVTDESLWRPERCPVYIFTADPHVYGFPIFEQPGWIKVARELFDTIVDPEDERRILPDRVADLSATIADRFNGVDPTPTRVDACLYTEAPNRDFFVDRHPDYPAIVIAAGFSGRGFKFGVGMGQVLADLAQSEPGDAYHSLWLPRFSLTRLQAPGTARTGVDLFDH